MILQEKIGAVIRKHYIRLLLLVCIHLSFSQSSIGFEINVSRSDLLDHYLSPTRFHSNQLSMLNVTYQNLKNEFSISFLSSDIGADESLLYKWTDDNQYTHVQVYYSYDVDWSAKNIRVIPFVHLETTYYQFDQLYKPEDGYLASSSLGLIFDYQFSDRIDIRLKSNVLSFVSRSPFAVADHGFMTARNSFTHLLEQGEFEWLGSYQDVSLRLRYAKDVSKQMTLSIHYYIQYQRFHSIKTFKHVKNHIGIGVDYAI